MSVFLDTDIFKIKKKYLTKVMAGIIIKSQKRTNVRRRLKMSLSQVIRTLFEIGLVVLVIWAVFHEDMFIAVEERILSTVRRKRLKVIK